MKALIDRISTDLKLEKDYIASIIRRSNYYYKDYMIPKKNGSQRHIAQASPELKTLQYWVRENILTLMPISGCSFAYSKGNSIKHHAEYHRNAYFIFHADINNFFPSITSSHLIKLLEVNRQLIENANLWYDDLFDIISKICFRNDHLCIGTVSSPTICNIVMYDLDEYFKAYCDERNWKYSRYADDIYVSSQTYLPKGIRNEVDAKLTELGFSLNNSKTGFRSKKSRREITGLVLTESGRVSIGNENRSMIKKMIYNRIVHGQGNANVVLGYLAFLKDIEPKVYDSFLIKYAAYCEGDVIAAIRDGPGPKYITIELPDI